MVRLPGFLAVVAVGGLCLSASAQVLDDDHGQYSRADAAAGQGVYSPRCMVCHGRGGDGIQGIDLRFGKFKRVSSDEDLVRVITGGILEAGMPAFVLQPAELKAIVAYIRSGFDVDSADVAVGSAERGRVLFEGKGECASCHRVGGRGPRLAPDLSDIGAVRTLAALQRSVRNPTAAMLPINRPVQIVTKDRRTIRGRRLNEDTYTVQLIDEQERLLSLDKSEIAEFTVGTTSPMPAYEDRLSAAEIADVVAYLASLKGL